MSAFLAFLAIAGQAKHTPKTTKPPKAPAKTTARPKKTGSAKSTAAKTAQKATVPASPIPPKAPSDPAKICVGDDVAKIGKIRPGHYVADRDFTTLPRLADTAAAQLNVFSGNVYIITKGSTQITAFIGGRKRIFDRDKGTVEVGESLRDFVHAQDAKADIRLVDATYANFEVLLPNEAKKLDHFSGTLTFFAKNMTPEQSLSVTLRDSKVATSSQ